jgi:hypothetical protein
LLLPCGYGRQKQKVLESLQSGMERGMGALNGLSTSIVTYAQDSGQTFPFVRVRNFAAMAAQTVQFTNAFQTALVPVVKPEIREQWETYASSKNTSLRKYINETEHFMSTYDHYYGPLPSEYNWSFYDKIYDDLEMDGINPNTTQPYYLPEFHLFPLVIVGYGPANFGMFTLYKMKATLSFRLITIHFP